MDRSRRCRELVRPRSQSRERNDYADLIRRDAEAHERTAYYADHMNYWSAINHVNRKGEEPKSGDVQLFWTIGPISCLCADQQKRRCAAALESKHCHGLAETRRWAPNGWLLKSPPRKSRSLAVSLATASITFIDSASPKASPPRSRK
jgi:hypothetical protein